MFNFGRHYAEIPATKSSRKRGRRKWHRFLLLYTLCLLFVGIVGCFILYHYLDAYEASRPEHVMDALMAETSVDEWCAYTRSEFEATLSEFEDHDSLFSDYYNAALKNANYTYRRDRSDTSFGDTPVYVIRAGAAELCRIILTEKEKAGFGMYTWAVGEIIPCFRDNNLQSVAVEIDAPPESPIFLNGIEIDPSYIVDDRIPCPGMTELEQGFDDQTYFVRYRVAPLYGSISVTDGNGVGLRVLDTTNNSTVSYVLPETKLYSYTINAPSDLTVSVGGVQLTQDNITSSSAGVLGGLEEYAGDSIFHTVTYQLSNLYTQPKITATDSAGNTLHPIVSGENSDTLTFFHAHNEALYQQTHARVEEFFSKYIQYSQQAYSYDNYSRLLSCILPDTVLYSYIKDSKAAMYWASETEVNYEELTFTDFAPVNDDCFTCTIRYKADFSAQSWYENYSYDLQNAYSMVFVRSGGEWYAAAMESIG